MFLIGTKLKNFAFFVIFSLMIIGCGQDNGGGGGGGNNANDGIGDLDANFGAGGILAIEAEGQFNIDSVQDAKNIEFQNRAEQKRQQLQFINRFNNTKLRQDGRFRAANDDTVGGVATDGVQIAYAGTTDANTTKVLFALTDTDGVFDNAFGADGRVAIAAGSLAIGDLVINGVIIDANGLVAVGTLSAGNDNLIAIRVDKTGQIDNAFGINGVLLLDDLEGVNDPDQIQLDQANSAILVGANIVIGRSSTINEIDFRAGVIVINAATGAIVNNFTTGNAGNGTTGLDAAVDAAGNFLIVGAQGAGSIVFKLDAVGALVGTFSNDGVVEIVNRSVQNVVIDANDNVVVAGFDNASTDTFLARILTADGNRDPAFNGGNDLIFEPKEGGVNQIPGDVLLQGTNIVVVGGGAAAGDIFGFVSVLQENGTNIFNFESQGLLDGNNVNENFTEGIVDPITNNVIAVGQAIEDGQATFDGVAVRVVD